MTQAPLIEFAKSIITHSKISDRAKARTQYRPGTYNSLGSIWRS